MDQERMSATVAAWAGELQEKERMKLGDIGSMLGEKGAAALIVGLSTACAVAGVVPGFSLVMGLPMLFLAAWLAFGGAKVALPEAIARRQLPAKPLASAFRKASAVAAKLERFAKPRAGAVSRILGRRTIGIIVMALSLVIMLPVPFVHLVPSIAIVVMMVGWMSMDGWLSLAGFAIAVAFCSAFPAAFAAAFAAVHA